jgi:hypothetical protein
LPQEKHPPAPFKGGFLISLILDIIGSKKGSRKGRRERKEKKKDRSSVRSAIFSGFAVFARTSAAETAEAAENSSFCLSYSFCNF